MAVVVEPRPSRQDVLERPILFSGPMVRAVLEGRKTQTRRVAKELMERKVGNRVLPDVADAVHPDGSGRGFIGWYGQGPFTAEDTARRYPGDHGFHCPLGRPGDRLWVRETWGMSFLEHVPEGRPATPGGTWGVPAYPHWNPCVVYRADGEIPQPPDGIEVARWSPSIHMPRWASRLTLEVTGVRVERLQNITPEDARAEGHPHVPGTERYPQEVHDDAARDWFMDLWDGINAERGHPWDSNPWVWVVTFRRLEEARDA